MLLNWFTLLGYLSLLVSTLALPIPVRFGSNAQRLARGLPPLPPVFKRVLPGYSDRVEARNVPTRVYNGRRAISPSPSPTPGLANSFAGRMGIQIGGKTLGFLGRASATQPIHGLNLGGGEDVNMQFTIPATCDELFNVVATNPGLQPNVFIGAGSSGDINVDSAASVDLTNIKQGVQSNIWAFNRRTQELSAQLTNSDGSQPVTLIAYSNSTNNLFFTGDIDAFNAQNTASTASLVRIFLHSF